jgi:hypothetical protein
MHFNMRHLSCLALAGLLCQAAFGAAIHGTIKDQTGAALVGAGVELREVPGPGATQNARTDSAGAFQFANLAGTRYRIRVTQAGFKTWEGDVNLAGGKDAAIEIALTLAESRASISIAGGRRQMVDALYRSLREAGIQDTYTVENVVLERDAGVITLKKGTIGFTPATQGRDTVAVFNGEGEFAFDPPLSVEKQYLKSLTEQEQLRESFDRALFCFTDDTGKEVRGKAGKQSGGDARLGELLGDFRKRLRGNSENIRSLTQALAAESAGNLEADLLADLYHPAAPGFFTAYLHGRKHSDLRFAVRPRGVFPSLAPEEVAVVNVDPEAEQEGIWYLSHYTSEIQRRTASSEEDLRVVEGVEYRIETVIGKNDHLAATSTITLRAVHDGERVIPFDLLPTLRVTRVSIGGQDIAFIQEDRKHDGSFYVVLPEAMNKGATEQLVVEYQGDKVVRNAGGGNFAVGARTSWYPSLNAFRDHTRFHLIFKVPKQYTLVSVGKPVRQWAEQDFGCSEWDSEVPVPVAGFNYGDFRRKAVTDSELNFDIEGYAAARLPDSLSGAEEIGGMSPARLNDDVMVQAQNAMRIFNKFFGKSEFNRIAVTQQPQAFFGQSWPTLVYLPILAYFDSTQRWMMGQSSSRTTEFVEEVTAHEVSHQWWGHMVGWTSYHDQWLSEGFAFFSAGLYLQLTEKNPDKYRAYWEHAQKLILEKNGFGKRPNDAGPVWLGLRLASYKNPGAYSAVAYRKGGYILHMLRQLMWSPKEGDQAFIEMMQDFVKTFMNHNASTEAFRGVANRHMTPAMDLEGNHRLDWFFREFVYGTAIPKYKFDYTVTAAPEGKWLLKATLTESEVDDSFMMSVPIYADLDGQMVRLGTAKMSGNGTNDKIQVLLPKKPKKVMINAYHDVLEM